MNGEMEHEEREEEEAVKEEEQESEGEEEEEEGQEEEEEEDELISTCSLMARNGRLAVTKELNWNKKRLNWK